MACLSSRETGRHDDRQTSQHRKPDQYVIYLHQRLQSDMAEISGDCCFTEANDPSERDTRRERLMNSEKCYWSMLQNYLLSKRFIAEEQYLYIYETRRWNMSHIKPVTIPYSVLAFDGKKEELQQQVFKALGTHKGALGIVLISGKSKWSGWRGQWVDKHLQIYLLNSIIFAKSSSD